MLDFTLRSGFLYTQSYPAVQSENLWPNKTLDPLFALPMPEMKSEENSQKFKNLEED